MTNTLENAKLLVVDDEPDLRSLYELALIRQGHEVMSAENLASARELLAQHTFDVIITDMRLPDGLGMELLKEMQEKKRSERCIMITAYGSAENAVEALKNGAFDYLAKPVELKQLRSVVQSALQNVQKPSSLAINAQNNVSQEIKTASKQETAEELEMLLPAFSRLSRLNERRALEQKNKTPQEEEQEREKVEQAARESEEQNNQETLIKEQQESKEPKDPEDTEFADPVYANLTEAGKTALRRMVGKSAAMKSVKHRIAKVATSMAPVLVHGESGTGKELVAGAIHACSHRSSGPFVPVNCGAIPENLLEAEFFGAKKGSYTGATQDREGFFQAARGGTLFLDEIGDLPLAMQAKLLRAIQERRVRALGDTQELPVDVRIVSATHKNLATEVAEGRFRQDLYYRLNVIEIIIPPLRERREDLPALCRALLAKISKDAGLEPPNLTDAQLQKIADTPLEGNVRELENLLHRAIALGEFDDYEQANENGQSDAGELIEIEVANTTAVNCPIPVDLEKWLGIQEKTIILKALEQTNFNRTAASPLLGISLRQMRYRMARLGINGKDDASKDGTEKED